MDRQSITAVVNQSIIADVVNHFKSNPRFVDGITPSATNPNVQATIIPAMLDDRLMTGENEMPFDQIAGAAGFSPDVCRVTLESLVERGHLIKPPACLKRDTYELSARLIYSLAAELAGKGTRIDSHSTAMMFCSAIGARLTGPTLG